MADKPNLIYILADDLGYGDISCLNRHSKIRTIHLDRLAREGLRFTDAHSSSAVCTPSRYSILTGRYGWRSALKRGVLWGYDGPLIEPGRMTVASLLQAHGYRTACIGKWHLGMDWARTETGEIDFAAPICNGPNAFGFDYYYGISASLDMEPYVYIENDRVTALPDRRTGNDDMMRFWREGPTAPDFKHEEVLPVLTRKVLDTMEAYRDSPFFIYFAMPAPHTPILPAERFVGASGTNAYGDFVLMCDDVVGQIMDKLDELKLAQDTILIFSSDNGCSPRADIETLHRLGHRPSYVYRGFKADIYEGGHRIPHIVRWPARIAPGRSSDEPVCLSDLLATMGDIIGVPIPGNAGEDSVSNLPVWLGAERSGPLREAIVHHSFDGSFAIRKGKWKLELCPGSGGWSDPAPGEEPADAPLCQLYDLDQDIGERRNLCNEYPEVVSALKQLLMKYIDDGRSTPGPRQPNTGSRPDPDAPRKNPPRRFE